jgi:hypothetical protein
LDSKLLLVVLYISSGSIQEAGVLRIVAFMLCRSSQSLASTLSLSATIKDKKSTSLIECFTPVPQRKTRIQNNIHLKLNIGTVSRTQP